MWLSFVLMYTSWNTSLATSVQFTIHYSGLVQKKWAPYLPISNLCLSTERSLLSTNVRPSLKLLFYKNILLWLMALSPKASCSIRWVSAAVFLRSKQNLMQILCCLKSVIEVAKKKLSDHWNITSQKFTELNTFTAIVDLSWLIIHA